MILKTSLLKLSVLFISFVPSAYAFNTFDCLRDMLPITAHGSMQSQRKAVEPPFMLDAKHMVFPEVNNKIVTGFYLYDRTEAWYFDAFREGEKPLQPIGTLNTQAKTLFQMVAQPQGLETITIHYMPGYSARESNKDGPVILGASILPVIGAFVSRPDRTEYAFQNPAGVNEDRLKGWVHFKSGCRKPAEANQIQIERRLVRLDTMKPKARERLFDPLNQELSLRQHWISSRNLDNKTFQALNRSLDTNCKSAR